MESRRSTLQFVVATVSLGSLGIFATQARLDARTIFFNPCLFGAIAMGICCLFLGHFRAIPKQDFLLACGTGFLRTAYRLGRERHRQRRQLMEMDDRELNDIGITREQAEQEARKPIWKG